jgi:hypothetical protein
MRWRAILVLGILFVVVVIARWPAGALARQFPLPLACAAARGTVWRGTCDNATVSNVALGQLGWRLQFWPLLTGRVVATLQVRGTGVSLYTDVVARRDRSLQLRALHGEAQLAALAPILRAGGVRVPDGFGGAARARVQELRVAANGRIALVRGTLEIDALTQAAAPTALGSWLLTFDGALSAENDPIGTLVDRGGPFDFRGTLRLTPAPGYVLEGALAPRAGVPPDVVNALRYMGGPDAAGRRPFGIEGNF